MNVRKRIKLLIIEDNKTVQFALKKLLGNSTIWIFEIDTSYTLSDGFEKIEYNKYDVVLSDLELPDSTREETLQELKQKLRYIPFVILTATDDDKILLESVEAGAQDYLCKSHIMNNPLLSRALYYAVQHWELKSQLKYMASHDDLTGAINKRFFLRTLDNIINLAERYNDNFCLAICDLDDFRNINNNYGHVQGDKALKKFVDVITETVRESDIIARFGGDEFCILLHRITKEECQDLLIRLSELEISIPSMVSGGKNIRITGSYGGAQFKKGMTGEELLAEADKALYQVKKNGKGHSIVN